MKNDLEIVIKDSKVKGTLDDLAFSYRLTTDAKVKVYIDTEAFKYSNNQDIEPVQRCMRYYFNKARNK